LVFETALITLSCSQFLRISKMSLIIKKLIILSLAIFALRMVSFNNNLI
jgi:hypothetical protein